MTILVVIAGNPDKNILVKLHTQELVREFKSLLLRRRTSHAMVTALSKGKIEKEIGLYEMNNVNVALIISEKAHRWDLCT